MFAVWLMFGVLGIPIRKEFGLTDVQLAWITAVAVLNGAIWRLPAGIITDRQGGRKIFALMLAATAVPAYLISTVTSYQMLLFYAFLVGFAGNSFSVGIAWVAAWWPRAAPGPGPGHLRRGQRRRLGHQVHRPGPDRGRPRGRLHGWLHPRRLAVRPLPVRGRCCSSWPPSRGSPRPATTTSPAPTARVVQLLQPLKQMRVWRFSLYYVVTFGAYVALAAWLPKYYVDVYDQSLSHARPADRDLHLPRLPPAAPRRLDERPGGRPAGHVLDLHASSCSPAGS